MKTFEPLSQYSNCQSFDVLLLFASLRDTGKSDSFHIYIFLNFACPLPNYYIRGKLKTFQRRQDRNKASEIFASDLRWLRTLYIEAQRVPQNPRLIELLKCFLSMLNFKCLQDLPAYEVSVIACHNLWHGRCDNSKSCKVEETIWKASALTVWFG